MRYDLEKAAQDLLEKAEPGRLERSKAYTVDQMIEKRSSDQRDVQVMAIVGGYVVKLLIVDKKRSYRCTCQDHNIRKGAKGPCKHVLALASKLNP